MNPNKKPTLARDALQPFNRQAGPARQLKPAVVQFKTPISAQSSKRPVAPPVYRPQPTPVCLQAKMAVTAQVKPHSRPPHAGQAPRPPKSATAAQPHTPPRAPQVYAPQTKMNAQSKLPAQMKAKVIAPPATRPQPVQQPMKPFWNKTGNSVQLSKKARIRRARQKEKKRLLREPALPAAPDDPDDYAWQIADASAAPLIPAPFTTEMEAKELGDGAAALTSFRPGHIVHVDYDPDEAQYKFPHKRVGALAATFTHELAVHGKNALVFADSDAEHGAMHDPETRNEYLAVTYRSLNALDNATQKRAFARAWLNDIRNQILWHPSPGEVEAYEGDDDEEPVAPLGKGEKRARLDWANRRYRDMMKAINVGEDVA